MLFDSFEAYDVQAVRKESREAGRLEGKLEGKLETHVENILSLLEDFGTIPNELYNLLKQETCPDTLNQWLKLAAKAESMEDFLNKIKKEH